MLLPLGTPTPATATRLERNARTEEIIRKSNEILKEADAKEAEVMAEAKRRDTPNQLIYGLLLKDGSVVGYLYKDGGMAYLNPSIVDGVAVAQATRSPKEAADWIEANIEGLTVERFPDGSKAPTIRQADALMNKTAALWARENPIRSSAPEPDSRLTGTALRVKQLNLNNAQKLLPTEPQTTEERWQRNIDWFKTDQSA